GPQTPQEAAVALPEEDAVIHQLSQRLGLPISDSKDIAAVQFAALQSEIDNQNTSSEQLKKTLDAAYRVVLGEVLSRWPILDDPWHPDFQDLVNSQRDAIATWLTDSPNYAAYLQALGTLENLEARLMQLRLKSAPYERLLRAFETRTLARRLRARGGKEWVIYERLLSCERAHL
ncbi:MAG: hypothetical protein VX223_17245, partial [Myxococcota bacterium]|nr:hypothetical protein [Myxococcota bacterium]